MDSKKRSERKPKNCKGKQFSRRDFLKTSGAVIASAVLFNSLAACTPKTTTVTQTAPTVTSTATKTATTTATTTKQSILLRYGSYNSSTHFSALTDADWLKWITDQSGGRVQFQTYYGGTVITLQDGYNQVANGVVDLACASPVFQPYDLTNSVTALLCGIRDRTKFRQAVRELESQFPEIPAEISKKYKGFGIYGLLDATGIGTASKSFTKLSDLKGLQIKAVTGWVSDIVQALGCTPVIMPLTDAIVSLQKNIIDGLYITTFEQLKAFSVADVIKYMFWSNIHMGNLHPNRIMNLDTWNKLSPDIQQIFNDSSDILDARNDYYYELAGQAGIDYAKQKGVQTVTLPAADMALIDQITVNLLKKDVADVLTAKGYRGLDMYNAGLALNQKYSQ